MDNTSERVEWASDKAHDMLIEKYGDESYLVQGETYKDHIQDEFNELYDRYYEEYNKQC